MSMKYILDERYRLRGWLKAPAGLFDTKSRSVRFLRKPQFLLLIRCDGAHDLEAGELSAADREYLDKLLADGVVRPAGFAEFLKPEQEYRSYPARYKRLVQWSITGACNLKCRHCFMSAPHAKHGSPSLEQLRNVADQLAACGIFHVSLTGGEPLIRGDFFRLIDMLNEREITVDTVYTNGWLLDEHFLDELEKRRVHPSFQLSFDGVDMHDFLRGVPGAEERTVRAMKLLRERKYAVAAALTLHRKNKDTLRETVKFLASLGITGLKCGTAMELGEWAQPEVRDLQLSREEVLELYEAYIPQFFEDEAPISITLQSFFDFDFRTKKWGIGYLRKCSVDRESTELSCSILRENFYIGADGMVCPCMGMADTGYAEHFPNLQETPLEKILGDSDFERLCHTTVREVRDSGPKCRECRFVDRCVGGCRNVALLYGDDFSGINPECCWFFEHDGEARVTAAAQEAYEAYLRRNPLPEQKEEHSPVPTEE